MLRVDKYVTGYSCWWYTHLTSITNPTLKCSMMGVWNFSKFTRTALPPWNVCCVHCLDVSYRCVTATSNQTQRLNKWSNRILGLTTCIWWINFLRIVEEIENNNKRTRFSFLTMNNSVSYYKFLWNLSISGGTIR